MLHYTNCSCRVKIWSACEPPFKDFHDETRRKAGGILSHKDRLLMVQSRGKYWGFPKGTSENGESPIECAKREIKEETSIDVNLSEENLYLIHYNTHYYKKELERKPRIEIPDIKKIDFNDCTGIAWVSKNCLFLNRGNKNFCLNSAAKKIIDVMINEQKTIHEK